MPPLPSRPAALLSLLASCLAAPLAGQQFYHPLTIQNTTTVALEVGLSIDGGPFHFLGKLAAGERGSYDSVLWSYGRFTLRFYAPDGGRWVDRATEIPCCPSSPRPQFVEISNRDLFDLRHTLSVVNHSNSPLEVWLGYRDHALGFLGEVGIGMKADFPQVLERNGRHLVRIHPQLQGGQTADRVLDIPCCPTEPRPQVIEVWNRDIGLGEGGTAHPLAVVNHTPVPVEVWVQSRTLPWRIIGTVQPGQRADFPNGLEWWGNQVVRLRPLSPNGWSAERRYDLPCCPSEPRPQVFEVFNRDIGYQEQPPPPPPELPATLDGIWEHQQGMVIRISGRDGWWDKAAGLSIYGFIDGDQAFRAIAPSDQPGVFNVEVRYMDAPRVEMGWRNATFTLVDRDHVWDGAFTWTRRGSPP